MDLCHTELLAKRDNSHSTHNLQLGLHKFLNPKNLQNSDFQENRQSVDVVTQSTNPHRVKNPRFSHLSSLRPKSEHAKPKRSLFEKYTENAHNRKSKKLKRFNPASYKSDRKLPSKNNLNYFGNRDDALDYTGSDMILGTGSNFKRSFNLNLLKKK